MQKISTCLWFNGQAEQAAKFYTSLFKNGKIGRMSRFGESGAKVSGQKKDSILTVEFTLENQTILALNGGPQFKFTPALSYFVWCDTAEETDALWKQLSEGGEVRMGLDTYPWSQKYGWTSDRFGVEWQVMQAPKEEKIAPGILFVEEMFGKGEEAINFYMSLFPRSKIDFMSRDEATKTVAHCMFKLNGQDFVLMEGQGKHGYSITPAFSFVVNCDTQAEIDAYWEKLSAGGSKGQCGWVTDKFGVSWQVVPAAMAELMSDPVKSERVMSAMLNMTKLDLAQLKAAGASA